MNDRRHGDRPRHHHHHEESGPPWARHVRGAWMWPGMGGGRRARRGDVRTAILSLLEEEPMHGYDVMHKLEERSGGLWRPSPGSIYPTLQLLEDEGMVVGEDRDGRHVYSITDTGRAEVKERRERFGGEAPWAFGGAAEGFSGLKEAAFQLGAAAMQVARTGSSDQVTRAAQVLGEARKKLYAILAED